MSMQHRFLAIDEGRQQLSLVDTAGQGICWTLDLAAWPLARDMQLLGKGRALVGFDRREPVTIPPLPDAGQWDALEAARQAMLPNYGNGHPAQRYRAAA